MLKHQKTITKPARSTVLVCLFFLAFFLYGCLVFRDYGISVDEMSQRGHSLVNYKFMVPWAAQIRTNTVDFTIMGNLGDHHSFYGVAVQIPAVIAEHLTGFTIPYSTIFRIRHFYTFFLFWISAICFYKCCRLFTENRYLALIGTAIYILNPRTLADAFYNIKDLMGLSLCMILIYFGCKMLREMKQRNLICFALFGALGTNCRIVLAVVLAAFLFSAFLQGAVDGQLKKRFFLCLEAGLLSLAFYFIMTPSVWVNTLQNVKETVDTFSNYTAMPGTSVYQGSTVTGNDLSRTYVFVWMLITIPIAYLLFSAAGMLHGLWQMIRMVVRRQKWSWVQFVWLALLLSMAVPLGYVLLLKPVVYNGWRHFYFLYAVIALGAFFGLLALETEWKGRKKAVWAGRGLLAAGLLATVVWIGINHPFEYVYFNLLARHNVEDNYDRDYWGLSSYQAIQYICETDPSPVLKISTYNGFSKLLLEDKDWSRIQFVSEDEADYIIENYQKGADTGLYLNYYFYDKIQEYQVDGFPVCTIYKRVYDQFETQSMYQDKNTGGICYPMNRQEIHWEEQVTEQKVTLTGVYREPVLIDAFFTDTTWEEAVPGTTVWLSEDGVDWRCVNEMEGSLVEQFAIMARLPESMRLQYVKIEQDRVGPGTAQEHADRRATMHIRLYRNAGQQDMQIQAVSPFEKVMGHENPVYSDLALDGDLMTHWETEHNQTEQMIYDIFLDDVYPVSGVRLDVGLTGGTYARNLRVFLSADNETWTEAVVFTENDQEYYFESMPCQYIRLMTGDAGEEPDDKWAIGELELLTDAQPVR